MAKKSSAPTPLQIRLNDEDEQQVTFIQQKLSAPGTRITKSDALRRALHAFANQLRAQDKDRRVKDSASS